MNVHKYIKKNYIFLMLCSLLSCLFLSCHDDIYNMITREVASEDGLSGDIRSIVPFKNYLYLTNNNIYRKTAASSNSTGQYNGQWAKVSSNLDDYTVLFLASDATYLYALTTTWEEDEDESETVEAGRQLWYSTDGTSWTEISISYTSSTPSNLRKLFDNQDQDSTGTYVVPTSNRKAYITYYDGSWHTRELNGATTPSSDKVSGSTYIQAAYNNGTAFTTNYALCAGNGYLYWAENGSTLYYGTGSSLSSSGSVDLDHGTILSLAATTDYLLVGTTSGITRVALSNGVPASSTSSFGDNNADSLLTSRVPLLYIRNKEVAEEADDEYGAMVIYSYISSSNDTFSEVGLYAYYSGRGSWNRDGD